MTHNEIIEQISKEMNLNETKTKLIVDSFWKTLRYYLTNPLESKSKILIPHIGSFNLSEKAIVNIINKLNNKEIKRTQTVKSIEFYENLLNVVKNNERQSRKKIDNE